VLQPAATAAMQEQRGKEVPPASAYADETAKATAKLPDSSDADYADVVRTRTVRCMSIPRESCA
jgi:hypothetical protein